MSEAAIRNFLRPRTTTTVWMALGFSTELVLALIALALLGTGERGTDVALQLSARLSFLLFLPAWCINAMATLCGPPFDRLRQRARDFGLAFAAAHLVHLSLVVWLCWIGAVPPITTFLFFGFAALWTYVLALLSIDRLHRAVGHSVWRWLNLVGLNFIALAFTVDFLNSPFQADAKYLVGYLPFVVLALGGLVLRVAAWGLQVYQRRRNSTVPAR
jgi:hypothetical protein